jgi:hypothetical protein
MKESASLNPTNSCEFDMNPTIRTEHLGNMTSTNRAGLLALKVQSASTRLA